VVILVDFDNTLVEQSGDYEDVTTPLRFLPGAKEGLLALKRAGHTLVLWSGRASPALREDPKLDPLVRAGKRRFREGQQELNEARYQQMLDFVEAELPDVFSAIDDGKAGKIAGDLYLDDRCQRVGRGQLALGWPQIGRIWGEPY
jgi:hypothetical protein